MIWASNITEMRTNTIKLILASSSTYRKALLERLHLPFICVTPDIDETPLPGESPQQQVLRLAEQKALKVGEGEPDALIIGSDQIALLGDQVLGKPGTYENAYQQLQTMCGQRVRFLTGLSLINTATDNRQHSCEPYDVYFRNLSDTEIERYLKREQPYHCAGSFKSEQLGISLVEKMGGGDPTALVGLPLISLCRMLNNEAVHIP